MLRENKNITNSNRQTRIQTGKSLKSFEIPELQPKSARPKQKQPLKFKSNVYEKVSSVLE